MFHHGLSWHPPPRSAQPVWAKFSTSTYIQATYTPNTCHICHLNYQRIHLTHNLSRPCFQHLHTSKLLHCYIHTDENINNCGFCLTFHFLSVRPTTPTSSPMYKGIYAINALPVWAKFSTSSYIPPTYTLMTKSTRLGHT